MFRLSALLAIVLLASGCGVTLRTPAAPVTTTVTAEAPAPPPRVNPLLPPVIVEPLVPAPGQTVVTLTFDDGRDSNSEAAQIMNAYGLRGTFFVNSGNIGQPTWLTLADLDWIATNSGNEIGGHTIDHPKLDKLDAAEVKGEICDDRATLMDWGFPVRNFAYPFGYHTPEIEQIVASCGYNSARGLGELVNGSEAIETVPPADPFRTVSPAQVEAQWTVADLQQTVNTAAETGGGWVQLTFHGICPANCSEITPSVQTFTDFVMWLADQQAQGRLIVRTVGEVIGGHVQPAPAGTP